MPYRVRRGGEGKASLEFCIFICEALGSGRDLCGVVMRLRWGLGRVKVGLQGENIFFHIVFILYLCPCFFKVKYMLIGWK